MTTSAGLCGGSSRALGLPPETWHSTIMDFCGPASIEHHAASAGNWSCCLRKGTAEVWVAGGPGVGMIGYALSNKTGAEAAIAFETAELNLKDDLDQKELWRIVNANKPCFKVLITSEPSTVSAEFLVASIWFESTLFGHLVINVSADGDHEIVGGPFAEIADAELLVGALSDPGPSPGGP